MNDLHEVLAVAVLQHGLGEFFNLFGRDPAGTVGNFFQTGHFEALAFFERGDELAGFEQAVVRAGVEPGVAPAHDFDIELGLSQVAGVHIGDFQLATGAGADAGGDVAHLLVVEIKPGDGVVALGLLGLFFDAEGALGLVKLDHAIALGVGHVVGEDAGTFGL